MSSNTDIIVADTRSAMIEDINEKYEMLESDLNEIQNNLNSTITNVKDKIPTMLEFLEAAQNDKMYTAAAKFLQTYAELNRTAADLVKQKQEMYDNSHKNNSMQEDGNKKTVVNNDNRTIAFHGTPTELLNQVLGSKDESS